MYSHEASLRNGQPTMYIWRDDVLGVSALYRVQETVNQNCYI